MSESITAAVAAAVFLMFAVPAFADDPHGGSASAVSVSNAQATGGAGGAGGGASVTNVNAPTNTNTNVGVNTQSQSQQSQQSQRQRQNQNQNNDQTIAPSQSVQFKDVVQDRIPGLAVAPGLTAAGTGVCLGSVSFGLSGPMAGASFGITKVDQGCEARSGAALLYNMGHPAAALRVLTGESVKDALAHEGELPVVKVSTVAPSQIFESAVAVQTFTVQGN
jgi:hypothetical protein